MHTHTHTTQQIRTVNKCKYVCKYMWRCADILKLIRKCAYTYIFTCVNANTTQLIDHLGGIGRCKEALCGQMPS